MRITAVEEYGLRCLLNLARAGRGKQMSISEIAESEGLSVPYASKLLSILRKAGLVQAVRGRSGGFRIARDPGEIDLYEVLFALGGPLIDPDHCQKHSGQLDQCVHTEECSVQGVLGGLAGYVQSFLAGTSLQEIVDGRPCTMARQSTAAFEISDTAHSDELRSGVVDDPAGN
ncbi:MAG: Rrf2 family transcriptional regulator [Candidatus Zixiibacteriota bacterium]|nr:MAG: Rrf2 family transcriptional regulator [candidate division Zixibacteria bacterium]